MKKHLAHLLLLFLPLLLNAQNRGLNLTSDSETMLLNDGGNPDTISLKLRTLIQIGNTAELIPSGTTGTRPTGVPGYFRHNKTTGRYEGVLSGTTWVDFLTNTEQKHIITTRTLPTTVGEVVQVGFFTTQRGELAAQMDVTVNASSFLVCKSYQIVGANNGTGGAWQLLMPVSSTGAFSGNDFQLEIKTQGSVVDSIRIRRSGGTTAGSAIVRIAYGPVATASFTETSSTSNPASVTATYSKSAFSHVSSAVGVNTIAPVAALDVVGTGATSATDALRVANSSGTRQLTVRNDGRTGIGTVTAPATTLHATAATGTTTPIFRIENTGGDADFFVTNATPEGAITGSPGDIALRTDSGNGKIYVKGSGTGNTGWIEVGAGGATDHGALTGLSDDDHAQYLLLAGRATGQVATGGTASGDDLTLRSTTDATKGDVIVQDQGGNLILGGGTTAGELRFMEPSGSGTNYTEIQCGAMAANQSYVWPTDAPSDGEILAWHTGGLLSWDAAGGAAFYQTLQIGGTDQTQRAKLNINPTAQINVSYSDDAGGNRSNVEFSIADNAIGTTQIDDGAVGSADLNQMGATTGQLLRWDGSFWSAANFDDDANITDITSDLDNYTPTTWSTENVFTIGANNIWTISGFGALPGGTERTFINTSSNAIIVASGHPDSDASNRVQGPSDYIIGPYGGSISMRYSTNYSKWYVTNCTYNPGTPAINGAMGHYYNATVGATTGGDWGNIGFGLAGGANATTTPTTTLPAGWQLGTSTSATGAATLYFSKTVLNPTFYSSAYMVASTVVYIPTLSDGTQTYTFQFGLVPSPSSTTLAVNNSIGFRYSNGINSGEWEGFSRNNSGTESTADLNIAVAVDTRYILTMVVDKAKTEARFFINGSYAGRVTTNLPNNVAVGTRAIIVKSAGTTSRTVTIPTYTFYTVYP